MPRRVFAVVLVALLLTAPIVGVTSARSTGSPQSQANTQQSATIVRTISLSLTPDQPGNVDVTVNFEIPENVKSLKTSLPANASVFSTNGFTHDEGLTYEWSGGSKTPSLSFHLPANRSGFGNRQAADGQYSFVDTGSWAIVPVPQLGTRWSWVGSGSVRLEKHVTVTGEGATGGEIAYLGPHRTHVRTAHDQTFKLVVPGTAKMRESPSAVLDSVTSASDLLRVGARDEQVFFVAAPTSVQWAAQGIEYGGSDAWIRADARLDVAGNVWIHEYVHTRQAYETTSDTLWTVEAGAEYYSALLTLRQGRINFASFRDFIARGTRDPYADAVLSNPKSWPYLANYLKGALVYGALDRQIRLATESKRTMGSTLRRMNAHDQPVTQSFFLSTVGEISSAEVRRFAERYTTTTAVPEPWTHAEHQRAFATLPPRMEYTVAELRVSGAYRNRSVTTIPTLVTGETVTTSVRVSNVGGTTGEYNTTLTVNGTAVASATGTLAPEKNVTRTLSHTFQTPGTYPVSVGGRELTVTVREPATPQVSSLTTSAETIRPNGTVTVTATASNPTDRPATGPLTLTTDGTSVAMWSPQLDVGGQATRSFTVRFEEPGTHQISLGNRTTTVTVRESTPASETRTTTPGFSVQVSLAALIGLAVVAVRTRRSG